MIGALLAAVMQGAPVPFTVTATPFPALEEPRAVRCLALRAGLTLAADREGFGGYSDIVLDPSTNVATLVSDAGHLVRLGLVLDGAGDAESVASAEMAGLVERDGSRLGKRDGDAEGLADLGTGYAVSFEGEDRIAFMNGAGALGRTLYPSPDDARLFGANSGFEALTALSDGTLLAISEAKDANGDAVVRLGPMSAPLAAWARAAYRPAKDFNVTGASLDPLTGDLFVLERAYSPWRGVRMRIVRVAAERVDDDRIEGRALTRMGFLEGIDNMEGIAAARTREGALRLYLVSDDNFSAAQRTVLLTLGLAPGCEDGDAAEAPARRDAAPEQPVEP